MKSNCARPRTRRTATSSTCARALQGLIALLLSRKLGSNVPILAMLALYWLSVWHRRTFWLPFIVVMALVYLIP